MVNYVDQHNRFGGAEQYSAAHECGAKKCHILAHAGKLGIAVLQIEFRLDSKAAKSEESVSTVYIKSKQRVSKESKQRIENVAKGIEK